MENLGFGLGLRSPHYTEILETRPRLGWLEILSENFLTAPASSWRMLASLRADYPLVMHGVSLSIGSTDPLNTDYLAKLRTLADFLEVSWISDHLCFTGMMRQNTHDLLPIPYTQEAVNHLIPRIQKVQDILGRAFVFENASTYLEYNGATLSEPELLTELHQRTGCGILLDINNVHVSSFNHGWDARAYIDAIPAEAIVQYHLAGHADKQTYLLDTHDAAIADPVWELYRYTLKTKGMRSTMIEWDAEIPPLNTLMAELDKARQIAA